MENLRFRMDVAPDSGDTSRPASTVLPATTSTSGARHPAACRTEWRWSKSALELGHKGRLMRAESAGRYPRIASIAPKTVRHSGSGRTERR